MPWVEPDWTIYATCDACGRKDDIEWNDRDETNYPEAHGWTAFWEDEWKKGIATYPPEEVVGPLAAKVPEGEDRVVFCPDCADALRVVGMER
mgnify:CR=1 FL=1